MRFLNVLLITMVGLCGCDSRLILVPADMGPESRQSAIDLPADSSQESLSVPDLIFAAPTTRSNRTRQHAEQTDPVDEMLTQAVKEILAK